MSKDPGKAKRKALKKKARLIEKAAKRRRKTTKHKHNDLGKTYTTHRWGKLILITECTCGKVRAKDKLEK